MKKLIVLMFTFSILMLNNVTAEIGLNVGLSGNLAVFHATGTENENGELSSEDATGVAGYGSIFVEKTLGERFLIGVDYVPTALETETVETQKADMRTDDSSAISASVNKLQIDFEDLTTYYVGVYLTENFYAKAGMVTVDVITNENLETGSTYGNTDLDGTLLGIGYNKSIDNGLFFRAEGNYMNFDGASLTSSANSNKISLTSLDGVSGKISIGKTF